MNVHPGPETIMNRLPPLSRRGLGLLAGASLVGGRTAAAQQVPEFWNYLGAGGELEAVNALVAIANKRHPDTPITSRVVPGSTAGLRQQLQIAMMGNVPPAVSQFNTGMELRDAAASGRLLKINEAWDAVSGNQVFSEGLRRVVSIGPDNYGMPLSMSILGNCFYNKAIFDKLGLKPPANYDEFGEICARIKEAGLTPLGASSPSGFLFYQFYGPMLTVLGVDGFWAYTRGDVAFNGPEMRRAFALFKDRIATNFSKTWPGSRWSDSMDQLMRGEVAMCIIGDWGSGYMVERGWTPGKEYDFFAMPGLEKITIFQTDVVVAFKGVQEKTALNFLETVASPEGQAAFNKAKGSLAASAAAPKDFYNEVGRREFEKMTAGGDHVALPNPYLMIPSGFHLEVATEVERYASTLDDKAFASALDMLDAKRKTLKDAGKYVAW
jgi:ABC-type glycerol-3-phosphate transport system substrate-binding protein